MNFGNRFLSQALTCSLLLVSGGSLWASPLTLAVTPVAPDGACRLRLEGEPGIHYVLEQSSDLILWEVERGAQAPASGLIEWTSAVGQAPVSRFFRARVEDPAEVPASVTAELDAELSVQGMATEDGGELSLVDHDGTVYRLFIPANAVPEPVIVSMTIVTNLVGHPLDAADWRAVVFEPRGLEFDLPAKLQVEWPEGTAMNERVSFWFAADGADFGLVPDQVSSNTVVLPVYHFSGYGSGAARGQSFSGQMKRRVADPFQRLSQQIAGEIATERRAGLMPQDSPQLPAGSEARIAQAAADLIRHQFPNSGRTLSSSCGAAQKALGRVGWLLGLGKAYGLKSAVYKDAAERLRTAICFGITGCFNQYLTECAFGDPGAHRQFVNLESRVEAALGRGGCVSTITSEDFNLCRQGWSGFAATSHTEVSTNTYPGGPLGRIYERRRLHWSFRGDVVNVIDQRELPGSSLSLFRAEFIGVLRADWQDLRQRISWGCEGRVDPHDNRHETMSVQSGVLVTNITVNLLIRITPGFDTNVTVWTIPSVFALPIKSRSLVLRTDCRGQELENEWTDDDDSPIGFQLDRMSNPVFELTTDRVTHFWAFPGPPATGYWKWDVRKIP